MSAPASALVDEKVRRLAEQIFGMSPHPKDHWEVAAHLEVTGIRDLDARRDFGCADVFELAERVVALAGQFQAPAERRRRRAPLPWRFVRAYSSGLLFSMPMAAQIFAMILYGYSLWGWIGFESREATAIALGTLGSFVVTSGFTQAISRRGLFYINQGEDILTYRICLRIFVVGLAATALVAFALLLANGVLGLLPLDMVFTAQLYYWLLAILWLSFSLLYMLRKQFLFTLITVASIAVVHGAIRLHRWDVIHAQVAGLLVAIILSLAVGWGILWIRARRAKRDVAATDLPRTSMVVWATAPYFWYGLLYFTFLFADRLVAWSSPAGRDRLPYVIWFESRYELGMDWALLCFVLTMGVLEFTMREFTARIIPEEQRTPADRVGEFNHRFTRFYTNHLVLFLLCSVLTIVGSQVGLLALRGAGIFPFLEVFFNPITQTVFWWGAVGYVFLVFGLFNSVFLFALSRPALVLRALTPALALNLVVGFVLSRAIRYDLAVVGLTAGALAFLLLSSHYARRAFRRLDYYYYSAY